MKFGRFLRSHTIPEWNRAYVNYRLLKKAIGKAALELEELDSLDIPRSESPVQEEPEELNSAVSTSQTTDLDDVDADDEGVRDEAELRRIRETISKPIRTSSSGKDGQSLGVRLNSVGEGASTTSSGTESTLAKKRLVIKTEFSSSSVPRDGAESNTPLRNLRAFSLGRRGSVSSPRGDFSLTKSGDFNPRKFRTGYAADSINSLVEGLPSQSKRFFTLLENELDRVQAFYGEREGEAIKRFEELSLNWKQLAAHKAEYKAAQAGTKPVNPEVVAPLPSHNSNGTSELRRRFDQSKQQLDATIASSNKAFQSSNISKTVSGILLHGKPEEFLAAKSKLKLATFEYYRSLTMLRSYKVLNRTGFAKALKKFEKSTRISCSKLYAEKIDQMNFVASNKLEELITRTEDVFTATFEHGNRKKALGRLRMDESEKTHHWSTWRSGVYLGLGVPLLFVGLVEVGRANTQVTIPYWTALLQLFGAMLLPILFTGLFFFNLTSWHEARVNYVLIFELDVRTRMDYHQFLEIPSFLFFVFSLCFWMSFTDFWPDHISPSAYPAVFFLVSMVVLLNPLPILNPSARWWMFKSFCRVISAGLVKVEFRDFFLADELNSLSYCMYNLGFLVCTYNHGWTDDIQTVCSTNHTYASPILAALPAFWRFGQSIRRYLDSDGLTIHALNAGKYTATIIYYFVYFTWRINDSKRDDSIFTVWIVVSVVNSVYTSTWDILMDWNLGRRNSRHWFLRPELVFTRVWLYYVAIVVDVILRFSWVLYLSPSPNLSIQLRGYILAVLEVFRRIMWNAYRVESEHVGNVDGYRVTRDIALPYLPHVRITDNPDDQEDQDVLDMSTSKKSKFFQFFHTLHKDIIEELSPITSISLPRLGYRNNNNSGSRDFIKGKRRSSVGQMDYGKKSRGTAPESSTPASESDGEIDSATDVEGRGIHRMPTMEEMGKKIGGANSIV